MLLELNPGLIIWTAVTFLLLLFVLRRFAWGPILNALQTREESIRGSLERAGEAKREGERILEENRKTLARAEQESLRVIDEGKGAAERLKSEIVEEAHARARRVVEEARNEIQREKESALAQLRSEVADLAVQAAGKILDETLDAGRHRKLVDAFLRELPKN